MPIAHRTVPVFNKNVKTHVTEVAASMLNVTWEIINLCASVMTVTTEIHMLVVALKKVSDAWFDQGIWLYLIFFPGLVFIVFASFPYTFLLSLYIFFGKLRIEKHTKITYKIKSQYTTSQLRFAIRVPVLQMLFVENVMVLAPVLACLVILVIPMLIVSRNAYKIQNVHMTKHAFIISVWKRVPLMAFVVVLLNVAS